jgi:hypothetical protein
MKFVFLSAYRILGIAQRPTDADVLLFEEPNLQTRVVITSQMTEYWFVLDRHIALASMLLMGLVGQPLSDEFNTRLEEQISVVRNSRSKSLGSDGILIIEIKGDINADVKEPMHVIGDYVVCFDAYDKKCLHSGLQDRVASILVALRIGGPRRYELENIGTGSYLINTEGRIVHSFSIEVGTPNVYMSSPLNTEQVKMLREDIALLFGDEKITRVVRLFSHSLERNLDDFRSFISAWSAIEILIGKIFPIYHKTLISELSKTSTAPGLKQYLERISCVMNDKHTLLDKFAVISIFLNKEQQAGDIDSFKHIKRIRDRISHGEEIPDASLPLRELQVILDKYIRSYLRCRD